MPARRETWLLAASGHTFRQTPGARKNSAGSSGTTTFQKANSPSDGATSSVTHSPRKHATLTTWRPRQTTAGTRVGNSR
jgi:hypothetical protein